jgi:hypothetical protein
MSTRNVVRFLVTASVLVTGAQASAQNLLNNPSFESDLGFDFSNPANWNGFFGGPAGTFLEAFNFTGAAPLSGSKALVTTIRGVAGQTSGNEAFTGHVQIVDGLTAGLPYELSVWARTNPNVLNGAEFRIEWQNAGGTEISRSNMPIQALLTSSYQRFSIASTAPAGATRAAIVLAVQSFDPQSSPIADTSVAWDDAAFVVVPAPGVASLIGLTGLVSLRRRR